MTDRPGLGHNQPGMTEAELAAWNGLIQGDLEPLADLLAEGSGSLHPILQRWLVRLIRGSSEDVGMRLEIIKHPDLTRLSQGPEAQRRQSLEELRTALTMRRHGAFLRGQHEAAVSATAAETGLKRSTIEGHWSRRRSFIKICEAHGVLPRSPEVREND